jgi:predicted transcriptional regulator
MSCRPYELDFKRRLHELADVRDACREAARAAALEQFEELIGRNGAS